MSETQTQLPVIVGKPFVPKRRVSYREWAAYRREKCGVTDHKEIGNEPANGAGWLERKASGEIVYHTPWTKQPKPFDASAPGNNPKARVETQEKSYARMVKEFAINKTKHCDEVIGKECAGKWVITATDGHRLVFKAGTAREKYHDLSGENWTNPGVAVVRDKEFYNAVKRAAVMANQRTKQVTLKMIKTGSQQGIELFSSDPVGDFSEFVACEVSKAGFEVGFNADYLLDVLGVWPLKMTWKDSNTHVVFEPDMGAWSDEQAGWRAVVMPMRFQYETRNLHANNQA